MQGNSDWRLLILRGLEEAAPALVIVGGLGLLTYIAFAIRAAAPDAPDAGASPTLALGATLAFGTLAFAAGYLAGMSRAPVLAQLLPAIMALIGGFGVYLFGKEDENSTLVGVAVFAFSTCLLFGYIVGTTTRSLNDVRQAEAARVRDAADAAAERERLYDLRLQTELAQREAQINRLRRALGVEVIDFHEDAAD